MRVPAQPLNRRKFVAWMGGVAVLSACSRQPMGLVSVDGVRPAPIPALPVPSFGLPGISVRDCGALGDGIADDTASFGRAIATLGASGGTVYVPDGVYLIDPLQSVRLTSNITLQLAVDAVLKAIPVGTTNYSIVHASDAHNVTVTGGTIVGERNNHLGTTGEWGMGIKIVGSSDVLIEGVRVLDSWGDGIYVGATAANGESQRVTISKCIVRNNRRQGLSITGCIGALIEHSEFTETHGTAPESGIDLEPNATLRVRDVVIRDCIADRNAGYGILLCNPTVSAIKIESTQCNDNALDGLALHQGVSLSRVEDCRFERNHNNGIHLTGSSQNEVVSNTFRSNGRADISRYANVRLAYGASNNVISANIFVHGNRVIPLGGVADVTVATPDCVNNSVINNSA